MKQADLSLNLTTKRTRAREFVAQMERVVPGGRWWNWWRRAATPGDDAAHPLHASRARGRSHGANAFTRPSHWRLRRFRPASRRTVPRRHRSCAGRSYGLMPNAATERKREEVYDSDNGVQYAVRTRSVTDGRLPTCQQFTLVARAVERTWRDRRGRGASPRVRFRERPMTGEGRRCVRSFEAQLMPCTFGLVRGPLRDLREASRSLSNL